MVGAKVNVTSQAVPVNPAGQLFDGIINCFSWQFSLIYICQIEKS